MYVTTCENVKSTYLKCIAFQCLSPPCVMFLICRYFEHFSRYFELNFRHLEKKKNSLLHNICAQPSTTKFLFQQLTEEEEERRQQRRERNKLAAAKCREKKKVKMERLSKVKIAIQISKKRKSNHIVMAHFVMVCSNELYNNITTCRWQPAFDTVEFGTQLSPLYWIKHDLWCETKISVIMHLLFIFRKLLI